MKVYIVNVKYPNDHFQLITSSYSSATAKKDEYIGYSNIECVWIDTVEVSNECKIIGV